MANEKDKGFITWVFTIINLVIGGLFALGIMGGAISQIIDQAANGWNDIFGMICLIIVAVIWFAFAWYWIKRSIMIILGKEANTWVYVAVSFFMSALIGGILMLIAKILN